MSSPLSLQLRRFGFVWLRLALHALPDFFPWIADAKQSESVAFNFDSKLESLPNKVFGAVIGIVNGFGVFIAIQGESAAVMESGRAGLRVGLSHRPMVVRD